MKNIAVILFLLFVTDLNSQKLGSPNVIEFKSPIAAQVEKSGLIPNNLQSGQINPSIPIYEIKTSEISIPINLKYSNTGLKIGETPTWVGLGWNLFVGGIITQVVKGVPDNSDQGLIHPAANIALTKYLNNQMTPFEKQLYEYDVSLLQRDSERDIFNFNFLGQSGSFYFDASATIKQFEGSDLLISYSQQTGFFTIIDNSGFKFEFNTKEITSFSQDDVTSNTPIIVNGNTWYLTSITTPRNEVILFEYEEAGNFNEISYPYSLSFGADVSIPNQYGTTNCIYNNNFNDINIAQVFSTASEKHLKKITTGNSKILFNTVSIREDLTYSGTGNKGKALDEIVIQTLDNIVINKTKFTYSHFLDATYQPKNRLKLTKLNMYGSNENPFLEYKFSYQNEESSFPPLGGISKDFDHWGYYNGAGNQTTIPSFNGALVNGIAGVFAGADKNANSTFSGYGLLREIEYPTGGKVRFEYEPNIVNLGTNPVLPLFINTTTPSSYVVGGNRIKKVTYFDNSANEAFRQIFEYSVQNQLKYTPNYLSPKERIKEDQLGAWTSCGTFWIVSDRPVNSMPGFHIEYDQVVEKKDMNAESGISKNYFKKTDDYGSSSYPFPTIINTSWRSGISDKIEVYKNNESNNTELVKSTTFSYLGQYSTPPSIDGSSAKIVLDKISDFNVSSTSESRYIYVPYTYFGENFKKSGFTELSHTSTGDIINSVSYEYSNPSHNQVTKEILHNSKGEIKSTTYKYPHDFPAIVPYNEMINRHIISPVVEQTEVNVTLNNKELSKIKTNYQLWQSNAFIEPVSIQKSVLGNPLVTEVTINEYDNKGNILQVTGKDEIVTSYIWGYGQQYSVAKVVGKSYSNVLSLSGINLSVINNPADENMMRAELNKLRLITDAFSTTYTYKHLVGISSETDPRGRTIYYEYDKLNRLALVKDHESKILKKICYNYAGQPEDCLSPCTNTTAEWQNTTTALRCQLNAGQNTGYQEQEQKDMNPCSPTYNQLRWIQTVYNTTACPLPAACNSGNCSGNDKKCINGVCETGIWVVISATRETKTSPWTCVWAYCFSDGSTSTYTQTTTSSTMCSLGCYQ